MVRDGEPALYPARRNRPSITPSHGPSVTSATTTSEEEPEKHAAEAEPVVGSAAGLDAAGIVVVDGSKPRRAVFVEHSHTYAAGAVVPLEAVAAAGSCLDVAACYEGPRKNGVINVLREHISIRQ